ncbi:hypothetical protein C2E23DRAFT_684645, partial [Lenzites betulinus]
LHIVSDSRYAIDGLTRHVHHWEDTGWIGVANAPTLRKVTAALRARSAPTTFRWVKGHSGDKGNEEADRLAKAGADKLPILGPAERMCTKYLKAGVSLPMLTQSLAYKGICDRRAPPLRAATERNMRAAMQYLEERGGGYVSEDRIWMALREDVVRKQVRDFIWKAIHDALRVGSFWGHIPGCTERKTCGVCGTTEDLKHILVECRAPGREHVWNLTAAALGRKGVSMGEVTMGLALGAHATVVRKNCGRPNHAATRLARILIPEAVYLIWTLRCERVIEHGNRVEKHHTTREITRKWQTALTKRLRMDQAAARRAGERKKAAKVGLIDRTWGGLVKNAEELPPNWALCAGVLVG